MNSNSSYKVVAITGAAGALGLSLIQELKKRKIRSRALITENDDKTRLNGVCEEIIIGSVTDKNCCYKLLNGADAVINCAAIMPTSLHLGDEIFSAVNVVGGMNICETAEELGLKKAVFLSTIGVIDHTLETKIEDLFRYRTSYLDAYSLSKIELEKRLAQKIAKGNINISIVRPVFIYGPNSLGLWSAILTEIQKGTFKILGDGKAPFPMVHERDLANFILDGLDQEKTSGQNGVLIAGGNYAVTTYEVFSLLAKAMGKRTPAKIPVIIAYAAAIVADLLPSFLKFGPLKLLSRRRVKEYSKGYDLGLILKKNDFGFHAQTSLNEGLTEMVRSFERKNALQS